MQVTHRSDGYVRIGHTRVARSGTKDWANAPASPHQRLGPLRKSSTNRVAACTARASMAVRY